MTKLHSIALLVLLLVTTSCKKEKDNFTHVKESCGLEGGNILNVHEATGTLLYKQVVQGTDRYEKGIFIGNSSIEKVKLPLKICNFPFEQFPSLEIGDALEVVFSARIEMLPETVDASHLRMEIHKIKTIHNKN